MNLKLFCLLTILLFTSEFFAQNPNDCVNAIVICGDSNIGIDPTGVGFDEFSLPGNTQPPCYSFDSHTIWFKFIIEQTGTFTFDIIPDDGADYDFAIYGPQVTCTTLGNSIRCSSTNPEAAEVSANTGLNMEETDTEEGPGQDGNGYLKFIEAEAGDVYYLLVDRAVGSGGFSLFYNGTATLPENVTANPVEDLSKCDTDGTQDERTEFNLDSLKPQIIGTQTDVDVTFHESLNDANIGINPLASPYTNASNPQTIYARAERVNGCNDITSFSLLIGNPTLTEPEDVVLCSYGSTGEYVLDTIIPEVISDPTGYSFTYHNSQNEAENNSNPIGPTIEFSNTPKEIFVRVTDENDTICYSITSFSGYVNTIIPATKPSDIIVCDNDFDGTITVNLSEKNAEVLGNLSAEDFNIYYYRSEEDRVSDSNRIGETFQNTSNPQTIYVTFHEKSTGCFDYTEFEIVVSPKPDPVFDQPSYIYCLNDSEPIAISVQSGYKNYLWSTGEEGTDLNTIQANSPGTYSVTVTNEFNCTTTVSAEVFPSDIATITNVIIKDFNNQNNMITIEVEGPGDYEFALGDKMVYQDNPTFEGLSNGYYTVYVRDKNGCGVVSKEILVLDYPRFFTPNGDGYHDFWKIIGIDEFPVTKIYIYDRFGKLLKQILPEGPGWNGVFNGKALPASDYWFTIAFTDGRTFKGHFTLKR
ncbi:T9SS type B sorting domain-containing protein [Marixanthomonas ophiurae]|uniref:Gliding motility-associated C-terminal domain-containing protein n=1 Tax=Marixanthomonas ophiurae TaxID=387659 RepID=A0A3E1QCK6_9FLAO|nr:T9SS type B sorting domain-containing protein [Marixanthomonas ophiurae]RFN59842.1 gliding motility-associated C-terminal domain-containing protein [Marixanthomonas ophiurae]